MALVTVSDLKTYMDISFSNRQEDAAQFVIDGLQSELETYLRRPIEVASFVETHVLDSDHVGLPMSSSLFNDVYQQTDIDPVGIITYGTPPPTIYLDNSPVISVQSVTLKNLSTNNQVLGEALKRSASVSSAVVTSSTVTYTATNHGFTVGQTVTVTGMSNTQINLASKIITSVTASTFVVAQSGLTTGTFTQSGTAEATGYDYTVRKYGIDFYRGYANDNVTITYTAGLAGDGIPMFKLLILRAAAREVQNMHDDVVGIKDLGAREVALQETGFLEKELLSVKRWRRNRIG
jgi:hypothetical protein